MDIVPCDISFESTNSPGESLRIESFVKLSTERKIQLDDVKHKGPLDSPPQVLLLADALKKFKKTTIHTFTNFGIDSRFHHFFTHKTHKTPFFFDFQLPFYLPKSLSHVFHQQGLGWPSTRSGEGKFLQVFAVTVCCKHFLGMHKTKPGLILAYFICC